MKRKMLEMESGQTMWLLRYDIHVTCHRPLVRDERGRFGRVEPRFGVKVGDKDLTGMTFVPIDEAISLIEGAK